jgi:predicted CXXCH cytochrome family protein
MPHYRLTDSGKWEDEGVQCESCHGPGSVHVDTVDQAGHDLDAEELAAARAAIVASPDAQTCGQCHSQGTSANGDRPYPVGYRPGDNLLGAETYTLVAPDDSAHWRASGHAASQNMQYNEWLKSRHADSLDSLKASDYADDSCLQCHSADYRLWEREMAAVEAGDRQGDPPQPPTLDTARTAVTCSSCHDVHGAGEFDYDLVAKPYELCVACHGDTNRIEQVHHPVQEMYEGASVVENVSGVPSKHFTQGVLCTTCHMPPSLQTGRPGGGQIR